MTDPAFNLAMLQIHPNWYDHLSQVKAAMAAEDDLYRIRYAAGWTTDEGGWITPDGTPESDWADEGYPFPEDPEYPEFIGALLHYDATDAGELPELETDCLAVAQAQLRQS
jgi:hypothetical protein